MNESPEIVLERFFVLLLTREKITLGKLRTLETSKVGENLVLQVVSSMNYPRTRERIPLRYHFVCSDDEQLHQHGVVTPG
jgi:hypothetical protein